MYGQIQSQEHSAVLGLIVMLEYRPPMADMRLKLPRSFSMDCIVARQCHV